VGVDALEKRGSLVLKLVLDIIMDVDDSALRALTQSLQILFLKEVPGENVYTTKGVSLLLNNCSELPADTMVLLNDTMGSADCDEFSVFMRSVYFDHKWKTRVITHQEYLRLAESEYRTLYRAGKWAASKNDPMSAFFVGQPGRGGGCGDSGRGDGRGNGGRGGGCGNGNRWNKLSCHNCGKMGHISRNYWSSGVGAENSDTGGASAGESDDTQLTDFTAVDNTSIRRSPRRNEPRERTLPGGTRVKWCLKCGAWGDYFRLCHPTEKPSADAATPEDAGHVATDTIHERGVELSGEVDVDADEVKNEAFTRLRRAGLFKTDICSYSYQP